MPKKHLRRDSDIEQFGSDLARRWQPADGIEPWLRSLEPELSHKVRHERWSWEGIARALNAAGIVYETGRPWTGISLGHKIMSIRYEARQRTGQDAVPAGPSASRPPDALAWGAATPEPSTVLPSAAFMAAGSAPEDEDGAFRPASLKGWSGTRITHHAEPPPQPKSSPAPLALGEASAVIARLLGKP